MGQGPSEGPFLSEAEAGQSHAFSGLGDFHFHRGRVGSGYFGGTQHGKLTEHFTVDFGDEVVLSAGILPPHLPELYAFHGHGYFL